MRCYPLDNTDYTAADEGAFLCTRTRGVYSDDDNLRVTPAGGMNVSIMPGVAWLKADTYWGVAAVQKESLTLPIDASDGEVTRIDAAVCRLDKIKNIAELAIKKGSPASSPAKPEPVRNDNSDEIILAYITVSQGVINITNADITDVRTDENVCGVMRDGVTGIPTQQFNTQAQALIEQLVKEIAGVHQGTEIMLKSVYDKDNDGWADVQTISNASIDAALGEDGE